MINTATAYRNGNVTIGSGGSFLASNTLATVTGIFSNNGVADIVDATVNFTNALHVAGTLTLRNGMLTGSGDRENQTCCDENQVTFHAPNISTQTGVSDPLPPALRGAAIRLVGPRR